MLSDKWWCCCCGRTHGDGDPQFGHSHTPRPEQMPKIGVAESGNNTPERLRCSTIKFYNGILKANLSWSPT